MNQRRNNEEGKVQPLPVDLSESHTTIAEEKEEAQAPEALQPGPLEPPRSNQRRRANSASAATPVPFDSLPLELLKHTLEFVDDGSKAVLPLARCSRHLLRQWSGPDAWAGMPLFGLKVSSTTPNLPHLVHRSILQHALLNVCMSGAEDGEEAAALVDQTLQLPHLHTLVVALGCELATADWMRLLTHPLLQQVQHMHVRLTGGLTDKCVEFFGRLPQLAALSLCLPMATLDLAPLSLSSSLTRISVSGLMLNGGVPMELAQCEHLRELQLHAPPLGPMLVGFFRQPQMTKQLQRLSLCGPIEFANAAVHLPAIFSALTSLYTLELAEMPQVDLLLPHVAHCASLRLLLIRCSTSFAHNISSGCLPSSALLRSLVAPSQLRLEVQLWEVVAALRKDQVAAVAAAAATWTQCHTELCALEAEFVARVAVFVGPRSTLPSFV